MVKRAGALFILLVAATCLAASLFAQEQAAQETGTADTSVADQAAMPAEEDIMPADEGAGEGVITGEITSLDTATGVIAVKGEDGAEKTFSVVDGETILWKGIEDIKLSDVKKGEKAEVGYYTDEAGKLIASWVDVLVPEESVAPAEAGMPAAPAVPAAPSEETSMPEGEGIE